LSSDASRQVRTITSFQAANGIRHGELARRPFSSPLLLDLRFGIGVFKARRR